MFRRRREDSDWPTLIAGAAVALWGWRWELAGVALLVLAHVWLAGLLGAVAAAVLLVLLVVVVVVVPGSRRWLLRVLRAARVRRRWRRAWMDCGLLPVRAGRVRTVPAGELVQGPGGARDVAGRARRPGRRARRLPAACASCASSATTTTPPRAPSRWCDATRSPPSRPRHGRTSTRSDCRCGSRSRSASTSSARSSRSALPERNVLLGGEPGAGKSAALSLLVATAALDPDSRAVAARRQARRAVGVGAVRATARRPGRRRGDRAAARAARRDGGALSRAARRAASARSRRDDGLPLHLVACDELAFYLGREDRKQARGVRRAAARPRRARPRGRRDRLRRDAEARVRRGAVGAARPVRVPAGAALQHAAGLGHDPRAGLGDARAQTRRRSRPGSAASGCCSPRTALPVRMRGFHLPDDQLVAIAERASALRADVWLAEEGDAVEAQA